MRRLLLPLPFALLLLATAPAGAAQRYADPNGSGTGCTSGTPCTILQAVSAATSGDEVIVGPGTYDVLGTSLFNSGNINVHGAAGQPRPLLVYELNGAGTGVQLGNNSSVSDLNVQQTGNIPCCGGGTVIGSAGIGDGINVSDVKITMTNWDIGISVSNNAIISNVEIVSTPSAGAGGRGITVFGNGATVYLRNVTINMRDGAGVALDVQALGSGDSVADLRSVVIMGGAGLTDIQADESGGGIDAAVWMDHTNWTGVSSGNGTVTDFGDNQVGQPPLFVNAAAGDFRQLPGSPTVDAGNIDVFSQSTDIDGKPRPIGPAPDIGASEYGSAPTVTTGAGSSNQPTTATVSGTIDTNDSQTAYHFDYGTTSAYGNATGEGTELASLAGSGPVTTGLQGLEPYTTYHYRLVATNQLGTTVGADATFKTPAGPFSGLELKKQTLKASKKRVAKLRVRCPADTAGSCKGSVSLKARKGKRKLSLKANFEIAPNTTQSVNLKLSKKQYATLRKAKKMSGKATAKSTDAASQSRTTSGNVTLKK